MQLQTNLQTSDATVASAKETESSNAIVERDDHNVSEHCQSFAVVNPEWVGAAVETTAIYPHLTCINTVWCQATWFRAY